jgi:carbon storage regulator
MLVLRRKAGETIVIDDQIEVEILGIEGDTVKIGVRAPQNIEVHRQEIYLAIKQSNQAASQSHLTRDQMKSLFNQGK